MAPPGGDKDIIPPELIKTIPENRTVNYTGSQVELVFSEYIAENSIKNSISVLPTLQNPPDIIYKGKRILISFSDSLSENQTYIIVINRDLSDEHKVKLLQGIQIAFSTGKKIDDSSISGNLFNSKTGSVQLWKIKDNIDSTEFFSRAPDYSIDASDNGKYEFNFLSPGSYRIVALDQSLSGLPIVPEKMLYSLYWSPILKLKNQENLQNINMYIPDHENKLKMIQAEWITGAWGCITFSQNIEYFKDRIPIDIFYEDSTKARTNFFHDPFNNTKLNFTIDRLTKDYITIRTNEVNHNEISLLDSGEIKIRMDTLLDSTNISLISPKQNDELQIELDSIVPLRMVFSSLIKSENISQPFSIIQDSTNIDFTTIWENPISVKLLPKFNWNPKKVYTLNINSDLISPVYANSFKDSLVSILFKTSIYKKFGSLILNTEGENLKNLKVQLKQFGTKGKFVSSVFNSNNQFRMNRVHEGKYSLVFFQDLNDDNQVSSGVIAPYKESEWFYHYPDTIKIRANWDLEINQINLEKVY